MSRPVLLDLFCGAGGAAVGYHRAGFDVVGVDTRPQPRYPFPFVQSDALTYLAECGELYSAIHASPPCQRFTSGAHGFAWPDLVTPTRDLLVAVGKPWVIENVPGALLAGPTLCGTQFEGLRVIRHRTFEPGGFEIPSLPHSPAHPRVYTTRRNTDLPPGDRYTQVTGGGNCSLAEASAAMGVDWTVHKVELNEMVPPDYTAYVGEFLMAAVKGGDS